MGRAEGSAGVAGWSSLTVFGGRPGPRAFFGAEEEEAGAVASSVAELCSSGRSFLGRPGPRRFAGVEVVAAGSAAPSSSLAGWAFRLPGRRPRPRFPVFVAFGEAGASVLAAVAVSSSPAGAFFLGRPGPRRP